MTCLWLLLLLLRFALVMVPQSGYIHPDEFFQTVEVTAGNIFDIDVHTPWEFNKTSPIRSILLPYFLTGLPLGIVKLANETFGLGSSLSFWTLVAPRMVFTCLTLLIDLCVLILSRLYNADTDLSLMLTSTSYVMLVYLTRTFSNTIETILLSVLLLLLISISRVYLPCIHEPSLKNENLNNQSTNTSEPAQQEKQTFRNNPKVLASLSKSSRSQISTEKRKTVRDTGQGAVKNLLMLILIGFVLVAGVFNRPTFLAFVICPGLCLVVLTFVSPGKTKNLFIFCIFIGLGIVISFLIFVLADTFYYDSDFSGRTLMLWKQSIYSISNSFVYDMISLTKQLIVTPWNFIEYNTKSENLARHGLHPRYLHFVVNLPLLFGPLVIIFMYQVYRTLKSVCEKSVDFKDCALLISLIFPVLFLSLFPHQEPRFLLPVFPIMIVITSKVISKSKYFRFFCTVWISFNILMTFLFGFLHQGGVVPALQYIQAKHTVGNQISGEIIKSTDSTGGDRYIFFHTYMPPRFLLHSKYSKYLIEDLKGTDPLELKKFVSNNVHFKNTSESDLMSGVFVLTPGTVVTNLKPYFEFDTYKTFPMHISFEDPPDLSKLLRKLRMNFSANEFFSFYKELIYQLSLHIIHVKKIK